MKVNRRVQLVSLFFPLSENTFFHVKKEKQSLPNKWDIHLCPCIGHSSFGQQRKGQGTQLQCTEQVQSSSGCP